MVINIILPIAVQVGYRLLRKIWVINNRVSRTKTFALETEPTDISAMRIWCRISFAVFFSEHKYKTNVMMDGEEISVEISDSTDPVRLLWFTMPVPVPVIIAIAFCWLVHHIVLVSLFPLIISDNSWNRTNENFAQYTLNGQMVIDIRRTLTWQKSSRATRPLHRAQTEIVTADG